MTEHPTNLDYNVEKKTDLEGCIVTFINSIENRAGDRIPIGVPCLISDRPHGGVNVTAPPCPSCGSKTHVSGIDYYKIDEIVNRAYTPKPGKGSFGTKLKDGDTTWSDIFDNQDDYEMVMSQIRWWREQYDKLEVKQDVEGDV